jgi:GNAT superfamily N-acetyltransferase
MIIREAIREDIKQIQVVRNSVKENMLSNPNLVTDEDCEEFINLRGKGWVCEIDRKIVGFSIVDMKDHNVWALFLHPEYEGNGIGRKLHDVMLDWYFTQTQNDLWLGTAPGTRAAQFYHKAGWRETGMHGKETKFEMSYEDWRDIAQK